MISEVIFLYIIRAIITILGILEAKIMLKYFDQKALGMQTIFDQMIKDKLYLSLLTCTCIIIVDIILEISESVNELIATRVIFLFQLCALMELWQSIVINVIRSQCSKIWKKIINREIHKKMMCAFVIITRYEKTQQKKSKENSKYRYI